MSEAALTLSLHHNLEQARIASPWLPLAPGDFFSHLTKNGFSLLGYFQANPDSAETIKTPLDLFVDFCTHGIPEGRHFKLDADKIDLLDMLQSLASMPLADKSYVLALCSAFGLAFLNEKLFHDLKIVMYTPREAADKFSDDDIGLMLSCKKFGALPYFVFGDSHSRLYQHMRLIPDKAWLLPISLTCSGGSARGLCNANSTLKYGARIEAFFERIRPFVADGTKCFFKFCQVDIDYLSPYKWSQENYVDFDEAKFWEFANQTLDRYLDFLTGLIQEDLRKNIYVCSISLPTLLDEVYIENYVNQFVWWMNMTPEQGVELQATLRGMALPDIYTRTRLYLDFNRILKQRVEAEHFQFVDDAALFLDKGDRDKTRISDIFLQHGGGKDMHVDRSEATLQLIVPMIYNLVRDVSGTGSSSLQ